MKELKSIRMLMAAALVSLAKDDPVYAADVLAEADEMLLAFINRNTAPEDQHGPKVFQFHQPA
jgi:hypothetical protein